MKNRGKPERRALILYEHSLGGPNLRGKSARLLSFKSHYALLSSDLKYLLQIDTLFVRIR